MLIVFVRHGESEANVADFINDDPRRPVNLTGRGRLQAEAVAQHLRAVTFSHAYTSEFPRARQTAAAILREPSSPSLAIEPRLNERKSGMDGLPTCRFNDLIRPDPVRIRPPAGEDFLEQTGRVHAFMRDMEVLPESSCVLAVSHEYPLRSVLVVAGVPVEEAVRRPVANCETVVVRLRDGSWLLVPELEQ